MAVILIPRVLTKLLSNLVLMIFIFFHQTDCLRQKQTTLVFFLHDIGSGPNATVVPVIGLSGKRWSFNTFGTLFLMDDPITQTPSRNSSQVGRAQGMMMASALDGANVQVLLSLVFSGMQYDGSTLELQGTSRQSQNYKEVSVVSGTGQFRFARGFAAFETINYDPNISYSIIRCTITLLQASN